MISSGELLELQFQIPETISHQYPFNLPFLKGLSKLRIHPQVTFFVGENGMGKSTLLEAIAVASGFNAEGGSKNFNFKTRASHSDLHEYIRTSRGARRHRDGFFLRSESFFNVATEIERLDSDIDPETGKEVKGGGTIIKAYGGKSLHEQSHGESFWALSMNRLNGNGCYLLDEPEAAMSPTRQMALLCRMHELIGRGAQFIIATHSPILIAYPKATVYEFSETGIALKKYKETDLYKAYADFIQDSDTHVRYLLQE